MSARPYKGGSGQWAFISHRVTGLLVFMFLLLHVVDVSLINISEDLYNDVHELYGSALMRIFEVGLLAALVFHAFNGLRIITYDFFPNAIRYERAMFYAVLVVTLLATLLGGWIIIKPIFEGH